MHPRDRHAAGFNADQAALTCNVMPCQLTQRHKQVGTTCFTFNQPHDLVYKGIDAIFSVLPLLVVI
jgi:hypothetical protein